MTARTPWPTTVRSLPTSITVRPVTVTAEVAVNRASQSPTLVLEQSGLDSSSVPRVITSNPVTTVNWGTVRRRYQA